MGLDLKCLGGVSCISVLEHSPKLWSNTIRTHMPWVSSKWKVCLKILSEFCQIYKSKSVSTQHARKHCILHLLRKQCAAHLSELTLNKEQITKNNSVTLIKREKASFTSLEGGELWILKGRLDFQNHNLPPFVSFRLFHFPWYLGLEHIHICHICCVCCWILYYISLGVCLKQSSNGFQRCCSHHLD